MFLFPFVAFIGCAASVHPEGVAAAPVTE